MPGLEGVSKGGCPLKAFSIGWRGVSKGKGGQQGSWLLTVAEVKNKESGTPASALTTPGRVARSWEAPGRLGWPVRPDRSQCWDYLLPADGEGISPFLHSPLPVPPPSAASVAGTRNSEGTRTALTSSTSQSERDTHSGSSAGWGTRGKMGPMPRRS